jgi:hypothetical protein
MELATGIITVAVIMANHLPFGQFILKNLQQSPKEFVKYFITAKIRPSFMYAAHWFCHDLIYYPFLILFPWQHRIVTNNLKSYTKNALLFSKPLPDLRYID